jgi:3-dehydroquinate dehydratase I
MRDYKIIASISEEELRVIDTYDLNFVDILEIRLDLITFEFFKSELITKLQKLTLPLLFTYRLPEDSSLPPTSNVTIQDLQKLLSLFDSIENYIDIDLKSPEKYFPNYKNLKFTKIYSLHNFSGIYSFREIEKAIAQINDPNGIYKFAVMPKTFEEGLNFLHSIKELSQSHLMIGIWMGEMGQFTRIFGDLYGSSYTYGTLGEPKAPGQMLVSHIKNLRKLACI